MSLLHEDEFVLKHERMKDCVEIDVNEVEKSLSQRDETGYTVRSGYVIAFKKVRSELLRSSTKGSLTGNFSDPESTECSMM